ncbi:MAG: outer membrane beta-barrel protein [candidate division Zixibacteria bacterium]|nr:outer membrane beta-barrel protein [candidate division Zixibacteria bacterium]
MNENKIWRVRLLTGVMTILLLTLTIPVYSQSSSDNSNHLKDGSWAMQFRIITYSPDVSRPALSSFQGAALSVKYHLEDNKALRFGLEFSGRDTDYDTDYFSEYDRFDDIHRTWRIINQDVKDAKLAASVQYLIYPKPASSINWYWGIGPKVSYNKYKNNLEYEVTSYDSDTDSTEIEIESQSHNVIIHSYGISCVLGTEWFVMNWLSLHAEYSLYLRYSVRNQDQHIEQYDSEYVRTHDYMDKSVKLDPESIKFGLSVYF